MDEQSPDAARQQIESLYEEWFRRLVDGDWRFFEDVLDDDWVYTNNRGEVRGKEAYRRYIAGGIPAERAPRDLEDVQVRIFGNLGIVHGRYVLPGLRDEADRALRFTAVWIVEGARWRSLAHHTSAVVDDSHPKSAFGS